MQKSLPFLPIEILEHVILFLSAHEVETLALTFNKTLTPLCLRLHNKCFWLHDGFNDRRMITLFGNPMPFDELGSCQAIMHAAKLQGPFSPPSEEPVERLKALRYLRLDGSLGWLQPKCKTPQASNPISITTGDVEPMRSASVLGLKLPEAFCRFIQDEQSQRKIFPHRREALQLSRSSFIKLVGSIGKDTSNTEQGVPTSVDGYAFAFQISDNSLGRTTESGWYRSCGYYYLYLDNQGGECVISTTVWINGFWQQGLYTGDGSEVTDRAQQTCRRTGDFLTRITS